MNRLNRILTVCGGVMLSQVVNAADETSLNVGVMPSYSEGDYGTGSKTKILYVPFFAKYQLGEASFKVTVPYISETSEGDTVISGGTVVGKKKVKTTTTTTSTSHAGLGDIWLEGRYRFAGTGDAPDITPYLKVKLGTASSSDGLGTGKNDYEPGVTFEWTVATKYFPFADVGYRIVGEPADSSFNNILTYDAGVMYQLNDKHFLTGMFFGQQAMQSGDSAPADLMAVWSYKKTPELTIQVYFDKGLSDGSPDYMFGAGIQRRIR